MTSLPTTEVAARPIDRRRTFVPVSDDVKVLVLSGSMGAGKSTVLGAASELLERARIRHAALDLDELSQGHYLETVPDELMLRNLAAVWNNYAAAGARRALLSKPIDTMAKRDQLREAIPARHLVVCRLRADLDTMRRRVRMREPGPNQDQFVDHVTVLERYLDAAEVEDFSVDNNDRPVAEVAREVLVRAGWL